MIQKELIIGASKLAGLSNSEEEAQAAFVSEIPLGKAQATWDIGITAVYLASEAARCVNGDTIVSSPPLPSSSRLLQVCSSM